MGFGHRVYKNHDPRATVMRETCHEVLTELQIKDPLLDVAMGWNASRCPTPTSSRRSSTRTWTSTPASS